MDPLTRVVLTVLARVEAPGVELEWADALLARWRQVFPNGLTSHERALGPMPSVSWTAYAVALLRQATDDHGPAFNTPQNLRATRAKLLGAARQSPPTDLATLIAHHRSAVSEIAANDPVQAQQIAASALAQFRDHASHTEEDRAATDGVAFDGLLPQWCPVPDTVQPNEPLSADAPTKARRRGGTTGARRREPDAPRIDGSA